VIDLHSHILAGIDDGARTLDDTLSIAQNAVENGVTHMMCTPHIHLGTFDNTQLTIKSAYLVACKALQNANVPLKLAMACEIRICPEIMSLFQQDELPYIGSWQGRSALLLELPHSHIPPGTENLIKWLLSKGIQPIIPHPERNRDILANYNKAKWLKQQGCLFQLTAGAFVNRFSESVFETAWQMLNDQMVDYVASDTHNTSKRPNDMKAAYHAVVASANVSVANDLFVNVPQKLTQNVNWQ